MANKSLLKRDRRNTSVHRLSGDAHNDERPSDEPFLL
jgi:hypothetical protein